MTPPTIASGLNPVSLAISLDNSSVYVANSGSDTISMYRRDLNNGLLTAMSPATISTQDSPYSIVVSADGISVYVANRASNTISMYSRDVNTGQLSAIIPATIAASQPWGIAISPDGSSVYINTGTGGSTPVISMYSRNSSTGLLTALSPATVATGTRPESVAVSFNSGSSVYTSNFNSNNVSMFDRKTSISQGNYTQERSVLPSNTLIYYRGYATNAIGTSYSPDGSFTTST